MAFQHQTSVEFADRGEMCMLDRFKLNLGFERPSDVPTAPAQAVEERPAQSSEDAQVADVIILGSGPAGWSAAIYTARALLRPLLITGNEPGGQIATTTEVENYPGFPEGVIGPELNERFQKQAEKFGTAVEFDSVTAVDVDALPFRVSTASGRSFEAKSLIIATGASALKLGVPGEELLTGRGVSYCGTCDGFFFRGKEI